FLNCALPGVRSIVAMRWPSSRYKPHSAPGGSVLTASSWALPSQIEAQPETVTVRSAAPNARPCMKKIAPAATISRARREATGNTRYVRLNSAVKGESHDGIRPSRRPVDAREAQDRGRDPERSLPDPEGEPRRGGRQEDHRRV